MSTVPRTASPFPRDAHGIREMRFRALGTECLIKFRMDDERRALEFAADALGWLGRFEAKYSRFLPDSLISKINAAAGKSWVPLDEEASRILDIADEIFERTEGILDATMLPLLRIWNWKAVHECLPDKAMIEKAMALTGWKRVERRPGAVFLPDAGMGLDLGGFGKELAVDAIVEIARQFGIRDLLVDLGRDVFAMGGNGAHSFWHVGIEDGMRPGSCWGGLAVSNRAVSASGNYARQFTHQGVRYGHILDPRTGWPVRNEMHAVVVVAPTSLEAGLCSTATFVLGSERGLELTRTSYGVDLCMQTDHGIEGSRDFGQWLVRSGSS